MINYNSRIDINSMKATAASLVEFLKKAPWALGRHAFVFLILFFVFDIGVGGMLAYRYLVVPAREAETVTAAPQTFQQSAYQSVLDAWTTRQNMVNDLAATDYTSPF